MFKKLFRDESGITALETAIILIAFVVVASVFAFTILSAGTFSTEKGREAIYAGLEQVSSSMEVYGSVVGSRSVSDTTEVQMITFTLAAVAGGEGVNVTSSNATGSVLLISYMDDDNFDNDVDFTTNWLVGGSDDDLLESNELAEVSINVSGFDLNAAEEFRIEIKPPSGGVVPIIRSTPASLDSIMILD